MNFIDEKMRILYFVLFLGISPLLYAVGPLVQEMAEQGRWVSAKFQGKTAAKDSRSGLEVVANYEYVHQNGRFKKPFNISGAKYRRGLFCHAPSKLIVRLPCAGKTFNAVVGVDTNDQTSGGRGSVVFSVSAAGDEKFNSGLMREGMAGVPVEVDLNGAREFVIAVSNGGDGIACDQADWVDAKVELVNGEKLWLGDMKILEAEEELFSDDPLFSFTYDGKEFSQVRESWEMKRKSEKLDEFRIRHEITYRDPKTDLMVRCVGIAWQDFPTMEWTLYFKNQGSNDTPILENIQALDVEVSRVEPGEFLLHHAVGSPCAANDFQPLESVLGANTTKRITAAAGRPTNSDMSYFNLEFPNQHGIDKHGIIVAVGWPGQWASSWIRDGSTGLRVVVGQELTHFKLLPGEEVRSPLIVCSFGAVIGFVLRISGVAGCWPIMCPSRVVRIWSHICLVAVHIFFRKCTRPMKKIRLHLLIGTWKKISRLITGGWMRAGIFVIRWVGRRRGHGKWIPGVFPTACGRSVIMPTARISERFSGLSRSVCTPVLG